MAAKSSNMSPVVVIGIVLLGAAYLYSVSRQEGTTLEPGAVTSTPIEQGDRGMSNTIAHANDADFQQKVLSADGRVLVDFYADWCGPCRTIAPMLENLAQENPQAQIVKVNVDDSPKLANEYGIESIPALFVFENGQVVDKTVGVPSAAQLQALLQL